MDTLILGLGQKNQELVLTGRVKKRILLPESRLYELDFVPGSFFHSPLCPS